MPKRFPLIELLVAIAIIALLSFPGEKKTGKEKPGNGMCVTLFPVMPLAGFAPRKKRRFILIELLVVIAIIAILAPPHVAAGSGEFKQLPFELRRTQYVELLFHRDG